MFSALGLLVADVRHDFVSALGGVESSVADPGKLEASFAEMEKQARDVLARQGFAPGSDGARALRRPQGGRPDL